MKFQRGSRSAVVPDGRKTTPVKTEAAAAIAATRFRALTPSAS
jgi:hypothetical protein